MNEHHPVMAYLSRFSDRELAFLVRYRLETLDRRLCSLLQEYVARRGLNTARLASLIAEKEQRAHRGPRCARCGAQKLEVKEYSQACLVCGKTSIRNRLKKAWRFLTAFLEGF